MSTINQKFYLVCVRPKTLFGHTPYSPASSSYCLSPKMARDITCVKAWHHLQPQQFLPPLLAPQIVVDATIVYELMLLLWL